MCYSISVLEGESLKNRVNSDKRPQLKVRIKIERYDKCIERNTLLDNPHVLKNHGKYLGITLFRKGIFENDKRTI